MSSRIHGGWYRTGSHCINIRPPFHSVLYFTRQPHMNCAQCKYLSIEARKFHCSVGNATTPLRPCTIRAGFPNQARARTRADVWPVPVQAQPRASSLPWALTTAPGNSVPLHLPTPLHIFLSNQKTTDLRRGSNPPTSIFRFLQTHTHPCSPHQRASPASTQQSLPLTRAKGPSACTIREEALRRMINDTSVAESSTPHLHPRWK